MGKNKENKSDSVIKIRMQKAIKENWMKTKDGRYTDEENITWPFQKECVHERFNVLDGFTLQYNSIMYTLQRVCGFRVRTFLLYDEEL